MYLGRLHGYYLAENMGLFKRATDWRIRTARGKATVSAHLESKCKEPPQKSPRCSPGTFFVCEVCAGKILEARVGIEPTHKGFAVFRPSPKPLKIPANSVECSTELVDFSVVFRLIGTRLGTRSSCPPNPRFRRFTSLLNVINHPVLFGAGSVVPTNGSIVHPVVAWSNSLRRRISTPCRRTSQRTSN
jgi:hypothetical protein